MNKLIFDDILPAIALHSISTVRFCTDVNSDLAILRVRLLFINKCYALLLISAGQKIPGVYTRPITRAQKLENLQLCMSFMGNRNINLQGIYVGGK